MLDWNWFFSAVAQAVAALVAVFTAFVVAKVVAAQQQHRQNLARVEEIEAEQRRIELRVAARRFEWYNAATLREALASLNAHLSSDSSPSAADCRDSLSFSPFMTEDEIMTRIEEAIADYPRGHNAETALTDDERALLATTPKGSWREINAERELIDRARADVVHHILTTTEFAARLKDSHERSAVVTWSIASAIVLFLLGVIWPLSFLPMPEGSVPVPEPSAFWGVVTSFKGLLLSVISVAVVALHLVILRINLGLTYSRALIVRLVGQANYEAYSRYFAIERQSDDARQLT